MSHTGARKRALALFVEAFSARLRQEVGLDNLASDLVSVVRETVQPAHVSVWLRMPSGVAVKRW